jgi:hypothetical protein
VRVRGDDPQGVGDDDCFIGGRIFNRCDAQMRPAVRPDTYATVQDAVRDSARLACAPRFPDSHEFICARPAAGLPSRYYPSPTCRVVD